MCFSQPFTMCNSCTHTHHGDMHMCMLCIFVAVLPQTLTLTLSRYAKANGGLVRMLSGISEKGTDYKDAISFAAELKLGTNSPTIQLPNDADPSEPVE